MTEEEKREAEIKKEAADLRRFHPDMPEDLSEEIAKWNHERYVNVISDNHLDGLEKSSQKNHRGEVSIENLLSKDQEVAYGAMVAIIGRDLAKEISKTPEIEKMFEQYVYEIQRLTFYNKK